MNKSDTISELAKALSKAQSEFLPIKRTEEVSYQTKGGLKKYKYAPLPNVLESIHKSLETNELAIAQIPKSEEDNLVIETILFHSSGEWISGDMVVCSNNLPPQEKGSALTYIRRYALSSILGVAADEDDDGEATTDIKPKEKTETVSKITEAQTKKIYASVKEKCITTEQARAYLKTYFDKISTQQLTALEASKLIEDIEAGKLQPKNHLVEAAKAN